jgi:hypothetical protein
MNIGINFESNFIIEEILFAFHDATEVKKNWCLTGIFWDHLSIFIRNLWSILHILLIYAFNLESFN